MSGGAPQPAKTTTTTEMSPEQRELYQLALPGVRQFAGSVPQRYGGETIAPFNAAQTAGQQSVLGSAGAQQTIADRAAGQSDFLMGNIWDPASNPNLQGAIDASVRPITQNFQETILPAIRGEASTTGNFGSSRQGIAEGLAAGRTSQAVGDTASKLVQSQYGDNLNASVKALGLAPQTQALQATPGVTMSGVGDVQQNMSQRMMDALQQNYNYDQFAPLLQSKEILGLVGGIPGGSSTSIGTGPRANPLMGALGGAATGASLGSAIFPGVGTGIGGGLGALLSMLGSR